MKSTKKSLLLSTLSLILCFAMLLGTTYAWFTDEVKSGVNKIVAGNLDIEVSYFEKSATTGGEWVSIEGKDSLFDKNAFWEPGHTEYVTLKIENKGSLALKYQMSVSPVTETAGTNMAGESFKLSDYLKFGTQAYTEEPTYDTREAARAAVTATATGLNQAALSQPATMVKDAAAQYVTLVIYMPDTIGNEANYKTGTTAPAIDLGITVVATQVTNESDSFGKDYDIETPWMGGTDAEGLTANTNAESKTVEIESAEQLAAFADAVNEGTDYTGYTVKLAKDIDLNNVDWTPIKANANTKAFTFDGNGKTILNLKVAGEKAVGLFAYATSCTIKGLTIDGANVSGINHVAAIAGNALCTKIENCTVKNAVITTTVKNNDDGDKAGAIAGYLSAESNASITGCTVENCTVTGYRDIGGLVGYVNASSNNTLSVKNNTVKNSTVINDRSVNYKNYTTDETFDVNEIIGEVVSNATTGVADNTATNVNVVAGATIGEAVKEAITNADDGDTILLPTTEEAIALPATMSKAISIVGNGEDTVIAVDTDANKNLQITGDVTFENLSLALNGNTTNSGAVNVTGDTTFKNVTITPNENGETPSKAIVVGGNAVVTYENVNFALNGKTRGIMVWGGSPKVYIKNCTFDCVYPFNVDAGTPEFIVTDSTLNGWTSYTTTAKASFTNCKFGKSTSGYAYARPYSNVTFTDCEFSSDFRVDFGAANVVITLNNCTQNGAPVNTSIVDTDFSASGKLVINGVETSFTKS